LSHRLFLQKDVTSNHFRFTLDYGQLSRDHFVRVVPVGATGMSAEIKKEIQLEIAHVLFIDIVGYSKLSINQQQAAAANI
jgi:hypothetical protein